MEITMDKIKHNRCDVCRNRTTGVATCKEDGQIVSFRCNRCAPTEFQAASEAEIARYMAGESID
jgi:hypothetical protein